MARSCNDVCDEVLRRLKALGFKLDDSEDHEQIFDALAQCMMVKETVPNCVSICDQVLRKLREAGVPISNSNKTHREVVAALEKCIILPKGEVQVVVGLQGGLIQDTFAFSQADLAAAQQAELDKTYEIGPRDAEGNPTEENDDQVITFVLPVSWKGAQNE